MSTSLINPEAVDVSANTLRSRNALAPVPEFDCSPNDLDKLNELKHTRIKSLVGLAELDAAEGNNPSTIRASVLEAVSYIKTGVETYSFPPREHPRLYGRGIAAIDLLLRTPDACDVTEAADLFVLTEEWQRKSDSLVRETEVSGIIPHDVWTQRVIDILPNHQLTKTEVTDIHREDNNLWHTQRLESEDEYQRRKYAPYNQFMKRFEDVESFHLYRRVVNGETTPPIDPYEASSKKAQLLFDYATTTSDTVTRGKYLESACGFMMHALEKPPIYDAKGFDAADGQNRLYAAMIMHDLANIPGIFSQENAEFNGIIANEARRQSYEWLVDAQYILANAVHSPLYREESIGSIMHPAVAETVRTEIDRAQAYDLAKWFHSQYGHEYAQYYDIEQQQKELESKMREYIRRALGSTAMVQNTATVDDAAQRIAKVFEFKPRDDRRLAQQASEPEQAVA